MTIRPAIGLDLRGDSPRRRPRRYRRSALGWAFRGVLCVGLSLSGLAAAQEQHRVALEYEMDPGLVGCPTRAEFESSVRRQLGYDPFSDATFSDEAAPRVVARASATGAGITGSLLWSDAQGALQGERRLVAEHRECSALARSMAFAMVVQLQLLDAARAEPESEPEPTSSAEPTPPAPPVAPPRAVIGVDTVSEREPPSKEGADLPRVRSLNLGVGSAVSSGLAPEWSALGRGYAAVHFERLSVELGAAASWPVDFSQGDGSGFRGRALLVTFAPCLEFDSFSGCALTQLGQLRIEGTGVDEPRTSSAFFGQAGARVAVALELGPLTTGLHLDVMQTFTRWTVELNDSEVWTTPGTALQLGIDVELPLEMYDQRER